VCSDVSMPGSWIAQYYVPLRCCVGRCISVVCDTEQHSGLYQNEIAKNIFLGKKSQLGAQFILNIYIYIYIYIYQSLHVSGDYVPIIRRNYCVYATLGTCYSVWMTVWYAWWNETESFLPLCVPDSRLHRITSTKCRINTVVSPDDGHIVARNM